MEELLGLNLFHVAVTNYDKPDGNQGVELAYLYQRVQGIISGEKGCGQGADKRALLIHHEKLQRLFLFER